MGEGAGPRVYNGVPAGQLRGARWRKSRRSSAQGNCIETARLPGDQVAVRNSWHPQGPALIFSQAEVRAFVAGVKDGDFDSLLRRPPLSDTCDARRARPRERAPGPGGCAR
jgi:hypothetical protein